MGRLLKNTPAGIVSKLSEEINAALNADEATE
jgi:hypothetical protein